MWEIIVYPAIVSIVVTIILSKIKKFGNKPNIIFIGIAVVLSLVTLLMYFKTRNDSSWSALGYIIMCCVTVVVLISSIVTVAIIKIVRYIRK